MLWEVEYNLALRCLANVPYTALLSLHPFKDAEGNQLCDHLHHVCPHTYVDMKAHVCIHTVHSHTQRRAKSKARVTHKINTITKNHESISYNYFLLQLLFWMRVSPWWCFGASVMRLVTDPRVDCGKRLPFFFAFLLQQQCVVYLIIVLCWWYVGFWAAEVYLRHVAKVHVPPASLLSAHHWSGTYCDSYFPAPLCPFFSTLL